LAVTIWAINTFDPEFDTMHLHPFLYQIRSGFIFAGGLCAVFVTNEIKKRIFRVNELWGEKLKIEGLFSQQVSPQVVEALIKDQNRTNKTNVTIFFLDIRNFSSFIELKDPQEVNDFQNKFFCPLIEIINNHNGIINQILGDGFMATFGAPASSGNDSQNAVNASLEIVERLNNKCESGEIPLTKIGIGLHVGNIVTGNVGTAERKQYTITGNTVILASRIEQLNKKYKSEILISMKVFESLDQRNIKMDKLGSVKVKGRDEPIEIVRLI